MKKTEKRLFAFSIAAAMLFVMPSSASAMHIMEGYLPKVVRPPCASSSAWKSRTMMPMTLMAEGPNRMAPRPVPVGWELEPVTLGIFKADSTKA